MIDADAPHSATPKMPKLDPWPWRTKIGTRGSYREGYKHMIYFDPCPGYSQNPQDYE